METIQAENLMFKMINHDETYYCLHLGIYRNCGEGKAKEVRKQTKVFII